MGLTPDAPEDEAGIKKAAENSKELWGGGSGELLGSSPSLGLEQVSSFHLSFVAALLQSQQTFPRDLWHPPVPDVHPELWGDAF